MAINDLHALCGVRGWGGEYQDLIGAAVMGLSREGGASGVAARATS